MFGTLSQRVHLFIELIDQIILHFNQHWTTMKNHPLRLKLDECSLRFPDNIDMDTCTLDMTIQEVYTFYQARPDRAVVNVDSKLRLPKGTSMVFELHINDKRYMERVTAMEGEDGEVVGGKRKRVATGSVANKHRGTTSTLASSFNTNVDYSILSKIPLTSKVTFNIVHCEPDGTEGRHHLSKDDATKTGAIEVNTLILSMGDRGKSKDVHKFIIDGDSQPYVAKKIFDIGKGRDVEVTPTVNQDILSRDLIRLKRLSYFLERFLSLASAKGLDELAEFSVSDAFMILVETSASAAATEAEADAYLVEPMRASSVVKKFTGTFGSCQDTDKLTCTILAFNHFIMQDTACLLAFADLQGSRHKGSLVLFDPMTHTIPGKSGTGDHGPKGIRDTIESHS
ncbi:hypothetical protein B0H11DRAFT_2244038 [Mycena galericulata]|nr:hypothetical protein B0H11DRAFT_2244038 [Mycena galericulata]